MFDLDKMIFTEIYNQCKMVGEAFSLDAFSGFVFYLGAIVASFGMAFGSKKK